MYNFIGNWVLLVPSQFKIDISNFFLATSDDNLFQILTYLSDTNHHNQFIGISIAYSIKKEARVISQLLRWCSSLHHRSITDKAYIIITHHSHITVSLTIRLFSGLLSSFASVPFDYSLFEFIFWIYCMGKWNVVVAFVGVLELGEFGY